MSDLDFQPLVFGTMPSLTIVDDGLDEFRIPATPDVVAALGEAVNDPDLTVVVLFASVRKQATS